MVSLRIRRCECTKTAFRVDKMWARGVAQSAECLPSTSESLSSMPASCRTGVVALWGGGTVRWWPCEVVALWCRSGGYRPQGQPGLQNIWLHTGFGADPTHLQPWLCHNVWLHWASVSASAKWRTVERLTWEDTLDRAWQSQLSKSPQDFWIFWIHTCGLCLIWRESFKWEAWGIP